MDYCSRYLFTEIILIYYISTTNGSKLYSTWICVLFQVRRTSERFAKPAIPSIGLNTSAPNILGSAPSHVVIQHHQQLLNQQLQSAVQSASIGSGGGGGSSIGSAGSGTGTTPSSLNSSLSSSFTSNSTLPASSSLNCVSFGEQQQQLAAAAGNINIVQPASPMDTSVCKD